MGGATFLLQQLVLESKVHRLLLEQMLEALDQDAVLQADGLLPKVHEDSGLQVPNPVVRTHPSRAGLAALDALDERVEVGLINNIVNIIISLKLIPYRLHLIMAMKNLEVDALVLVLGRQSGHVLVALLRVADLIHQYINSCFHTEYY